MIGEVLNVMKNLAADGMTMMCITHETGFARKVGNHIWFVDAGKILEKAIPDDFLTSRITHVPGVSFPILNINPTREVSKMKLKTLMPANLPRCLYRYAAFLGTRSANARNGWL